jgi:PadR family transcriptional regulator, regulatory protein PadR
MPSPRFPIPQDTLDMLILQILSLEPNHGDGWKQSEASREAKFYSLAGAGRKQPAIERASWDRLTGAVQLIFSEGSGS